jgi:hypothetical protein
MMEEMIKLMIRRSVMKKEDIWMLALVGFSILWTILFGLGVFG